MVMKCGGTAHVLQTVLMAYPAQASGLQGSHGVNCGTLAVDDLGTGSGWQQSKQNWAPLAVGGPWARMECSGPCAAELT